MVTKEPPNAHGKDGMYLFNRQMFRFSAHKRSYKYSVQLINSKRKIHIQSRKKPLLFGGDALTRV